MADADLLELRDEEDYLATVKDEVHVFRGHRCRTDARGHSNPKGRSLFDLRVHADGGFIPLWAPNMLLRYRFQERSINRFRNSDRLKATIAMLFSEALAAWGEFIPIRFTETHEAPDFEFVVRNADDCEPTTGCVLARAFFPDEGQHELVIYPKMFRQSREEQIETVAHEIGHIFGLRHFFANLSEGAWPSELFGTDSKFSIMNYGDDSFLTDTDRADLRAMYEAAWSGRLIAINGTPIKLMKPFSSNRP